ncbi:MAG: NUDIX hydrolase [Myxococcales bacterium]|nr:NUDIX hydrolase [Myxococcales bacterium]
MRREIHAGRIGRFGLEDVTLPNGQQVTLEILRHPGAAAVVPMHEDGSITLIRQHRHAAGGMIWEIPAGKLEPGESAERCAERELAEEAGLVGVLSPLLPLWTTPAFTDEVIHLFLARHLSSVPLAPEPDEVIEPVRLSRAEVERLIDRGEIRDGKTLVGILLAWRAP